MYITNLYFIYGQKKKNSVEINFEKEISNIFFFFFFFFFFFLVTY